MIGLPCTLCHLHNTAVVKCHWVRVITLGQPLKHVPVYVFIHGSDPSIILQLYMQIADCCPIKRVRVCCVVCSDELQIEWCPWGFEVNFELSDDREVLRWQVCISPVVLNKMWHMSRFRYTCMHTAVVVTWSRFTCDTFVFQCLRPCSNCRMSLSISLIPSLWISELPTGATSWHHDALLYSLYSCNYT